MTNRLWIALALLFGVVLAGSPAQAGTLKGYYYNSHSVEEIASAVDRSLARDASGNALIAPDKCRSDGSCATAAAYLASFQAHDPDAGLTSVSQVAGYLRSLIKDCTVTGQFEMDAIDMSSGHARARVSGMHRALRSGECVYRNPKTGRIVLAEHCANPIGRPLGNPCVYIDFQTGPEVAAHVAVTDTTDVCLAWRNVDTFDKRDDGRGWEGLPSDCGQMQCNFEDVARATGRTFGRIGGIPLTAGRHQIRVSPNNYVALCLEYIGGQGPESSFTAGVRWSQDYRTRFGEQHARIFYQSSELPKGAKMNDPKALFFWASTPEEAARIRQGYGI